MHRLCLVVGKAPDPLLEPFADDTEVPRYRRFLDDDEVNDMAEHLAISPEDLDALAARMPDWNDEQGATFEGRLYYWTTDNPNGKFDWYEIGGRFAGYLELRKPKPPSFLRGLFGAKPSTATNQARRREVVDARILDDPPAALLLTDRWHEAPLAFEANAETERWDAEFRSLFADVPDDALLTVVDCHS